MALKYQRILLKISGEALGGEKGTGFDEPTMDAICGGVKKAHELGVQIGIVVGLSLIHIYRCASPAVCSGSCPGSWTACA